MAVNEDVPTEKGKGDSAVEVDLCKACGSNGSKQVPNGRSSPDTFKLLSILALVASVLLSATVCHVLSRVSTIQRECAVDRSILEDLQRRVLLLQQGLPPMDQSYSPIPSPRGAKGDPGDGIPLGEPQDTYIDVQEDLNDVDQHLQQVQSKEDAHKRMRRGARDRGRRENAEESTTRPPNRRRHERKGAKGQKGRKGNKGDPGPKGERGEPGASCEECLAAATTAAQTPGLVSLPSVHLVANAPSIIGNSSETRRNLLMGRDVPAIPSVGGFLHKDWGYRAAAADAIYKFWQPQDPEHMPSTFRLTEDNRLQVTEAGHYLIYSQVLYIMFNNPSARNGYSIHTNTSTRAFISCILGGDFVDANAGNGSTETAPPPSSPSESRYQPCHTSGTIYLEAGTTVWVKDSYAPRRIRLLPHLTFVGLIKLSSG